MELRLNPDAPEFFPDLKKITQDGYQSLKKTVKSSKIFKANGKFDSLKTHPTFISITSDFSGYVNSLLERIVTAETEITEQLGEQCKEEGITASSNNILDRVNNNLEEVCEMDHSKGSDQNIPPPEEPINEEIPNEPAGEQPYGPHLEEAAATVSNQSVDNIENLWVPILREKPNSLVAFELKLVYNQHGKAIGYEHPYKLELDMYDPPAVFTTRSPEPIPFPAPLKNSNYKFVNTLGKLEDLVRHLREAEEIAVDVEHHSHRTYLGVTCLIQITTFGGDYIIDAVALRRYLYKLNYAFTDPKKIKILHGADMDVLWLQRDFGVYIVGLFDTHQAAQALSLPSKSLKALLRLYCRVHTDKKYQTADWRVRPLPPDMVRYARIDTHYLLYIWKRMKNQLLDIENGKKQRLIMVFIESRRICLSTYKKHVITETSHLSLYHRYHKDFDLNTRQLAALKLLYKWRDSVAKELDESPSYILPNVVMLTLAQKMPKDMKSLRECCPSPKPVLKRNLMKVYAMIKSCQDLPEEPAPALPRFRRRRRKFSYHMLDLPLRYRNIPEDIVMGSAAISLEADAVSDNTTTSYSTERSDNRFCPPYLRYMKCVRVEGQQNQVVNEAAVAGSSNSNNDQEEFTPIFKSKETREKEAEERAHWSPKRAEPRDSDSSDEGFTLVTRRKRNARGKRLSLSPEVKTTVEDKIDKSGPAAKRVYYQYGNTNYQDFYTPNDKKSNMKKRK